MNLLVNDEARNLEAGTSAAGLVALIESQTGPMTGRVAMERNRQIVPRSLWDQTILQEGDEIVLVQFVGGG